MPWRRHLFFRSQSVSPSLCPTAETAPTSPQTTSFTSMLFCLHLVNMPEFSAEPVRVSQRHVGCDPEITLKRLNLPYWSELFVNDHDGLPVRSILIAPPPNCLGAPFQRRWEECRDGIQKLQRSQSRNGAAAEYR